MLASALVVGRMGSESKGAGVEDAQRTSEQEREERRETSAACSGKKDWVWMWRGSFNRAT